MSPSTLERRRAGASPLIDPRLRDRRIEVARDHGRRRLRRAGAIAFVLALLAGAALLTRSPLLDVDQVVVRGADGAQADEVRQATGIRSGEALTDIDPAAVAARVEAVAWVRAATVERTWPDAVSVRVAVRTPVATVGSGRAAVLVDAEGRAIGLAGDGGDDLPAIEARAVPVGEQISAPARTVAGIVASLPGELRAEVATAGGGPADVELELRDGIVVAWGDDGQQSAKAEALGVLLAQDGRSTVERIDVSVPRASTVTFTEAAGE